MLAVSRSPGQSLVFCQENVLTVTHVESGAVWVALSDLAAPEMVRSLALQENELVDIIPNVRATVPHARSDWPGATLGLDLPGDMPVHRKEHLDANLRGP
jgi:hypothetical protein